jgi:hypothetical protein
MFRPHLIGPFRNTSIIRIICFNLTIRVSHMIQIDVVNYGYNTLMLQLVQYTICYKITLICIMSKFLCWFFFTCCKFEINVWCVVYTLWMFGV